jgi:hypothetical protein
MVDGVEQQAQRGAMAMLKISDASKNRDTQIVSSNWVCHSSRSLKNTPVHRRNRSLVAQNIAKET